ncbi:hypothetical protein V6N12_051480 [Hibiscus sabdariffa]|uniref:Uncharacterized protein n=1 Tax=Hibiscus sabdariffa TaxID=183260 RepID=A0ABR2GGQ1_9ROSI
MVGVLHEDEDEEEGDGVATAGWCYDFNAVVNVECCCRLSSSPAKICFQVLFSIFFGLDFSTRDFGASITCGTTELLDLKSGLDQVQEIYLIPPVRILPSHPLIQWIGVTAAYSLGPTSASEDSFSSKYRFHLQVLE